LSERHTKLFIPSKCSADAQKQLEERIIVPDDTRILLKKIGLPAVAGKKRKLKRVRFSLARTAVDSASDSSDDEQEEARGMKAGKRFKKKGSDDNEEFTLDAAKAELDGNDDEDDEEEEEGNGNGCSGCGTLTAKLHEDENTGDLLCNTCHKARGRGSDASGSGGKACYHCGNTEEIKLPKHTSSGGWECGTCRRYRASHKGELRPARLFNRKPRATAASPAAPGGNGGAIDSTAPVPRSTPLGVATPLNQQQNDQRNPLSSLLASGSGNRVQKRQARAQKRVFRLQERYCLRSLQLLKHITTTSQKSASIKSAMDNKYTMRALGHGTNQVAIEILSAKRVEEEEEEEGHTAWGDLRRQIIE
jgi:hypothetical protein